MLDIVIMGASGLTGMHCVPQMYKLAGCKGREFKWGIAGRSKEKLKHVLEKYERKVGTDLSHIPIIVCDIENHDSMFEMAQKTKMVINCVGPYILYGEKVVDACLKAGTHYIDACGEPQFMEKIQLTKNTLAKEKGVYIVSACGFDSLPCDLGITYLTQKFEGVLNSIITYLEISSGEGHESSVNYTTWESLVHNVSRVDDLKKIRQELFKKQLPNLTPKLKIQTWPHKKDFIDGWIVPFRGSDKSVVKRTQRYFFEAEKQRPVQIETFIVFKQLQKLLLLAVTSNVFSVLSKFESGRQLLLEHPRIFSGGMFSKKRNLEELKENSSFQITFYGDGWDKEVSTTTDQNSMPCNKKIVARMRGKNLAYESTGLFLVSSAVTLLSEMNNLPGRGCGGVYTPGAAFAGTSLMEFLCNNGIIFDILPEHGPVSSKL